jgi:hypothetical protein
VSLPFIYTIQLGLISYNIPTTAPTQQSTAWRRKRRVHRGIGISKCAVYEVCNNN